MGKWSKFKDSWYGFPMCLKWTWILYNSIIIFVSSPYVCVPNFHILAQFIFIVYKFHLERQREWTIVLKNNCYVT